MLDTHLRRSLLVTLGGIREQGARIALTESSRVGGLTTGRECSYHYYVSQNTLAWILAMDLTMVGRKGMNTQLGHEKENTSRPCSSLHSLQ